MSSERERSNAESFREAMAEALAVKCPVCRAKQVNRVKLRYARA